LPIVYVNRVGGQDELVFDGARSSWTRPVRCAQIPACTRGRTREIRRRESAARPRRLDEELESHVYQALVMGVFAITSRRTDFPAR